MSKKLISTVLKIFSFIRNAPAEYWWRQHSIYQPCCLEDDVEPNAQSFVKVKAAAEEDRVSPCVQRLQRLESLLEEIKNKPAEIPVEKDQILQQSLDRIKIVEYELENTKRVSFIPLILANLSQDLKLHQLNNSFLCPGITCDGAQAGSDW